LIPGNITSIGMMAFYYCESLTFIDISEGVTSIGHVAFAGCSGIESVVLPSTVTNIGAWKAFGGCTNLTSIINLNPVP